MLYKVNVNVKHRRHDITFKNNPGYKIYLRKRGPLPIFLNPPSQFPKALVTMCHSFNHVSTQL